MSFKFHLWLEGAGDGPSTYQKAPCMRAFDIHKLLTGEFDMNRFDFTPYRRSTVGFDRLFDMLENARGAERKATEDGSGLALASFAP